MVKQNIREIGDSFFSKHLEEFVDKSPYLAFVVLSAILEYMGHCLLKNEGPSMNTKEIFYDLINNVKALKKYRELNFKETNKKGNEINNNYLYKYLRCGMIHTILPNEDIVLSPDKNELSKRIVGAKELYEDIKKAWEELKSLPEVSKNMEAVDALKVVDELSGSTISVNVKEQRTTQD